MATVLKQDLLRSTFQERQIEIMTSIDRSVSLSERYDGKIVEFLTHDLITSIDKMLDDLAHDIANIVKTGSSSYKQSDRYSDRRYSDLSRAIDRNTQETSSRSEDIEGSIDREAQSYQNALGDLQDDHDNEASSYRDFIQCQNKKREDALSEIISNVKTVISAIDNIGRIFGWSIDKAINSVESYVGSQNTYVKQTGYTMSVAEDFQDSVMSMIEGINEKYGIPEGQSLISGTTAVERFVDLINATGVSDYDFYEEYGGVLLEAAESMDVHLGTLVEFSDKFSRKFNFTDETLNSLLEAAQQTAAESSLSADEIMSNVTNYLNSSETQYAINQEVNRRAQEAGVSVGSQEYRDIQAQVIEELGTQFIDYQGKMANMGMDPNAMLELVDSLSGLDNQTRMMLGIDPTRDLTTEFMLDPEKVSEELAGMLQGWYSRANSSGYGQDMADYLMDEMGFSGEAAKIAKDLYIRGQSGSLYGATSDWIQDNTPQDTGSEENLGLDQQYFKFTEKTANYAELIYEHLTDSYKDWGANLLTGLSVLGQILTVITAFKGLKLFSDFMGGSGLGKVLGSGEGGSTILGSLSFSSIGSVAVILGSIFGMVEGVKSILETREGIEETTADIITEADEAARAGLSEGEAWQYGIVSQSVDENGNVTDQYGYTKVSAEDYNEAASIDARLTQYTEDHNNGLNWWDRLWGATDWKTVDTNNDGYADDVVNGKGKSVVVDDALGAVLQTVGSAAVTGTAIGAEVSSMTANPLVIAAGTAAGALVGAISGAFSSNISDLVAGEKLNDTEKTMEYIDSLINDPGFDKVYSIYRNLNLVPDSSTKDADMMVYMGILYQAGYLERLLEDNLVLNMIGLSKKYPLKKLKKNSSISLEDYVLDLDLLENARDFENPYLQSSESPESLAMMSSSDSDVEMPEGTEGWETSDQPLNEFAVGTNYVEGDQVAVIHKGEAIIPADSNPYNGDNLIPESKLTRIFSDSFEHTSTVYNRDLTPEITPFTDNISVIITYLEKSESSIESILGILEEPDQQTIYGDYPVDQRSNVSPSYKTHNLSESSTVQMSTLPDTSSTDKELISSAIRDTSDSQSVYLESLVEDLSAIRTIAKDSKTILSNTQLFLNQWKSDENTQSVATRTQNLASTISGIGRSVILAAKSGVSTL